MKRRKHSKDAKTKQAEIKAALRYWERSLSFMRESKGQTAPPFTADKQAPKRGCT